MTAVDSATQILVRVNVTFLPPTVDVLADRVERSFGWSIVRKFLTD